MELGTLKDLYIHELKDLYSAEKQLIKALPKMAKAATNKKFAAGFEEHLDQTKEHVARLEKCKGMSIALQCDFTEQQDSVADESEVSNKTKDTMDTQHNPKQPGKPAGPGQEGGQQQERERQERERQQRGREKGGGGQQGGGKEGGGQQGGR
jgi:hypothetical protein